MLLGLGCAKPVPVPALPVPTHLPLEASDRLLYTRLQVGGREVRLMVDLGDATAITLLPEDADGTVHFTGGRHRWRDARGSRLSGRRFDAEIVADGRTIAGVPGHERVWSEDFAPPHRTGSIGRALLSGTPVLLDLAGGTLTAGPLEACEGCTVPFERHHGIVLAVTVDGTPVRALLDSGSTHTVWLGSDLAAGPHDVGFGELHVPLELVQVPGLAIPGVDLLLGHDLFGAVAVGIDWEREQLLLYAR